MNYVNQVSGNNIRYPTRKRNVNISRRVGIIDNNKLKKTNCDDILEYTSCMACMYHR